MGRNGLSIGLNRTVLKRPTVIYYWYSIKQDGPDSGRTPEVKNGRSKMHGPFKWTNGTVQGNSTWSTVNLKRPCRPTIFDFRTALVDTVSIIYGLCNMTDGRLKTVQFSLDGQSISDHDRLHRNFPIFVNKVGGLDGPIKNRTGVRNYLKELMMLRRERMIF